MGEPEKREAKDYKTSLAELEASVRVPVDDQITEQSKLPAEGPVSADELNRLRVLGTSRAGRW
jgi:hypothetical protein